MRMRPRAASTRLHGGVEAHGGLGAVLEARAHGAQHRAGLQPPAVLLVVDHQLCVGSTGA